MLRRTFYFEIFFIKLVTALTVHFFINFHSAEMFMINPRTYEILNIKVGHTTEKLSRVTICKLEAVE